MLDGLIKGPQGEALRFYEDVDKNQFQSDKQGRPIFDKVLYVEVITPGSRDSAPTFEVERTYNEFTGIAEPQRSQRYEMYKKEIEAWRSGVAGEELTGTPLKVWPQLDKAEVAEMNEMRIYTVEGLAALSDEKLRVLGPAGRAKRDAAKAFLEAAAGNAPVARLVAENEELRLRLSALEAQIANNPANQSGAVATADGKTASEPAPAANGGLGAII